MKGARILILKRKVVISNARRQKTIGIYFENVKTVINSKTNSNNNKVNSLLCCIEYLQENLESMTVEHLLQVSAKFRIMKR